MEYWSLLSYPIDILQLLATWRRSSPMLSITLISGTSKKVSKAKFSLNNHVKISCYIFIHLLPIAISVLWPNLYDCRNTKSSTKNITRERMWSHKGMDKTLWTTPVLECYLDIQWEWSCYLGKIQVFPQPHH